MSFSSETRLGPYEITAQIGAGGMGEVYRARDTKLGREVAIKVLPESVATDPERIARFHREAQVLASLNHPNIAHIHGYEESNGVQALVMEMVEGPTLADRIVHGPIRLEEGLSIAKQIAEALEAAHEQGIIHRDLKPANIKVRDDGTVKVLDFGLAKLIDPTATGAGSNPGVTASPTITSPAMMTGVGVILGTAAYMSPEQAKGRPADKRSDIWAFGCVLYEMLTARRAFDGDDVTDTMVAVLSRDPEWAALPRGLPPRVIDLIRLCLQREVRKRRRDAGDLVLDIEQIINEPNAPRTSSAGFQWQAHAGWIAAAVLAAAAIGAVGVALRPTARGAEMRLSLAAPIQGDGEFAVSPDGMLVAASRGAVGLWVRRLDQADGRAIATVNAGTRTPFWSADGRFVYYSSAGQIWKVNPDGGPPVSIVTTSAATGAAINSAGTLVFAKSLTSPLYQVSEEGGQPTAVTDLGANGAYGHMEPRFLPDGRHFLFFVTGRPDVQGVYLGSLDGNHAKRLTAADAHGEYIPPGYVAYVSHGALMARMLNLARGELTGEAHVIADDVAYTAAIGRGAFSISSDGEIVYRTSAADRRQVVWYDRTSNRVTPLAAPETGQEAAELSPDGRRVALDRSVDGNRDIWMLDIARGSILRLTFDPAQDGLAVWSPDSKQIVFESKRKGPYDLYVKAVDGGVERPILESAYDKWPMDWSRDGAYILYYETNPKTAGDLRAFSVASGKAADSIPVAITPFEEINGQFSLDGRWVAYQTNESGRPEVVVQSFPDPSIRRQVSTDGGTQPRWSHDGRELYFVGLDGWLMATRLDLSATSVELAAPVRLFQTRLSSVPKHQYSVAPDGRFLMNQVVEDAVSSLLTILLHWKPAAR